MESQKLKFLNRTQKMLTALDEKSELRERVMKGEKLEYVAKEKNIKIVQPVRYS